jgi:NAD(P)-dependent dehydrogenase (short-subunit alcohol dehydrogenase family)
VRSGTDLAGRRVLLTGASRGVGRAVARRLVAAGADVLGTARDEQLPDEVAREVTDGPGSFVPVVADLTNPATPPLRRGWPRSSTSSGARSTSCSATPG